MSLASVVVLLQTALTLLTIVNGNPALPQSMRDNAQQVAQQAIAQATTALASNSYVPTNSSLAQSSSQTPACSIMATPNPASLYQAVTLNWKSQNAVSAHWVVDTLKKDNVAPPYGSPDTSGSAPVFATVIGNPTVTLKVFAANGTSNTCTATLSVPSPNPTIAGTSGAYATIDQSSLTASTPNPTLTGTTNTAGVDVQIANSSGTLVSGTPYLFVVDGHWSYTVQHLAAGTYTVQILRPQTGAIGNQDSTGPITPTILASGILTLSVQ